MIRLIVACDRNRGIAKQSILPWNIPEDKAYYVAQTKNFGGNVLVGSATYKTLSSNLSERNLFVLTTNTTPIEGVEVIHDLKEFLQTMTRTDLWVIGGANVYSQVLDSGLVDEIYITKIDADFGCNQFFPTYENTFELQKVSDLKEQNGFIFTFCIYKKSVLTV